MTSSSINEKNDELDLKKIEQWNKYFELPQKEMRKQLKQLDFTDTITKSKYFTYPM